MQYISKGVETWRMDRPTPDVRSFAEILNHVADISYFLCSNDTGEAPLLEPASPLKGRNDPMRALRAG